MLVANPVKITHQELLTMARQSAGEIKSIYLHWTAGRYDQVYDDYHINIGGAGEIYLTCRSLTDLKAHTWKRNSRAVGVALCCALGAICGADAKPRYPAYAPTELQINQAAVVVAILCQGLGLPINFDAVKTHYETALLDGYGPNSSDPDFRWDLSWLSGMPYTKSLCPGGCVLRERALHYRQYFLEQEVLKPQPPVPQLAPALFAV